MENPRTPGTAQLWRMQQMHDWLRAGRRFTAGAAADEFQVSRRTVMSDIDHLRYLGVPMEYQADIRSYVLTEPSGELPALQITPTEWAAVYLAERVLESIGAEPHAKAVQRVVERISQHLPHLVDRSTTLFQTTFAFRPAAAAAPEPIPWLAELELAIKDQRATHITYYSQYRATESQRTVEPLHVLVREGHGYLVAWCRTRKDVLIFRTSRIRTLDVTPEVFAVRAGFVLEDFLGPMFGVFKDRDVAHVKIRFSPYIAPWIREDTWHASQVLTDLPDGSVQLDMDVTGLADVRRWVLGFGAEADVIEPERLRQDVLREWREMGRKAGIGSA